MESRIRFCPACGAILVRRDVGGRPRSACTRCSFVLYNNPAVAALAAVVRDGHVLLVCRAIEPYRGHWTLPAGYLELEESPQETARRETLEETGMEIEIQELLDVVVNEDDFRKPSVVVAYLARPVGGTLKAKDDAMDARFWPLLELPRDLGFVNNQVLLKRLVSRFGTGR